MKVQCNSDSLYTPAYLSSLGLTDEQVSNILHKVEMIVPDELGQVLVSKGIVVILEEHTIENITQEEDE